MGMGHASATNKRFYSYYHSAEYLLNIKWLLDVLTVYMMRRLLAVCRELQCRLDSRFWNFLENLVQLFVERCVFLRTYECNIYDSCFARIWITYWMRVRNLHWWLVAEHKILIQKPCLNFESASAIYPNQKQSVVRSYRYWVKVHTIFMCLVRRQNSVPVRTLILADWVINHENNLKPYSKSAVLLSRRG